MYDNCENCAEIIEVPSMPVLTLECPKCGHLQDPRTNNEYCTVDEAHGRTEVQS